MGLVDFTTFTEVEPDDRIQKTSTHVDHDSWGNEDSYLYKDYGAGYFGNFTHKIDVKSDFLDDDMSTSVWTLANNLDDWGGLRTGGFTALSIAMIRYDAWGTDVRRIGPRETYGGTDYRSLPELGINANQMYYLTITKSGTAFTLYVYTDSARTSLLGTRSLTLHGDWSFRYLYPCQSENVPRARHMNQDVENLRISVPVTLTISEILGMSDSVARRADFKKVVSEVLGMSDSATRLLTAKITTSEILGMRDQVEIRKHKIPIGDLPDHVITGGAKSE